jgi:branched-chain amino acid transport system permease protein
MVGAYVAYYLIEYFPHGAFSFWAGIFLATLIVGLIGVIVETLLLRRLYHTPELFILFATFGIVLMIQDLSRWLFGAEDILGPLAPGLDGSIDVMGTLLPQYDIALIIIAPLILGGLWLLLNRTRWGILVRAATEDREMSDALGVNQTWLFTSVFFLGSCLAGLGGAVQLPKGGANLLMDLNMIAAAFVIVVVGGMGSIPGAYLASVIIGELNSFGVLVFPQSTLVLMFLAMAVVLIIRPHGLFGKAEVEEHGAAEATESTLKPAPKKLKLLGLALLIFILVMPTFVGSFQLVLMTEIALFALVSMSLYFMAALMVHYMHSPMELAILLAPLFVGLLALIIGWFCVRLSGVYFAILTLAFAQICWSVVFQWGEFTGGDDGLLTIWPSDWASEKIVFYYLTMVLCIGGILLLRYFIFTPFGYTMRACRDSALRVDSIGINLRRHQWLAFSLAGVFAGLAGGIYVFSKGSVFPDEMAIPRSFEFLFMVLLGGVETLFGPVAGSAAFTWLHDKIARFDFWQLVLGGIFIFLVVAFPAGIAGSIHSRLGRYFED